MQSLLVVEDEVRIADHLKVTLQREGFRVDVSHTLGEIKTYLSEANREVDMVVLDRLLGSFDAKDLIPDLKKKWPQSLVLILSAINTPDEKSILLDMGADDYLSKPFSTQELVSRIRALLRRVHKGSPQFLQRGNTIIDSIRHTFSVNGKSETVPPKEFLVLRLLSQSPGRIYPKDEILNIVWRGEPSEETNVVEATITNLRRRLSQARSSLTVKNMRNAGYWLED